jgi:indolepyruvate ferredoxin oxidoreductase beta subunit
MIKEFNTVITGIGGQGSITLAMIIAEAASKHNYDVKTSELHGLSQRGGTIPCHVRFGKKIYSSVILEGEANLIIGLEPLEALRACYYGSKLNKTVFLIDNTQIIPISVPVCNEKYPSMKEIAKNLKTFGKKVFVLDASKKSLELTFSIVSSNVYLLGYASGKRLIPLKRKFLLEGMNEVLPGNLFETNKKVFEAGEKDAHSKN